MAYQDSGGKRGFVARIDCGERIVRKFAARMHVIVRNGTANSTCGLIVGPQGRADRLILLNNPICFCALKGELIPLLFQSSRYPLGYACNTRFALGAAGQ